MAGTNQEIGDAREVIYTPSMFKQFLLKKMVQSQLGKVPENMRPVVMKLVEEHPDVLMQLAQDFDAERKSGKSDEEAFMTVAKKHESTLKGLL